MNSRLRNRWLEQWPRCLGAACAAGLVVAAPAAAPAASPGESSARPVIVAQADPDAPDTAPAPSTRPTRRTRPQQPQQPTSQVQPDLDAGDQLAPSQMQQQMPAAVPMPGRPPSAKRAAATSAGARPAPGARAIACSGAFAKDSSHLKLAVAFDSKNITFTDVDSGVGGKIQASVIYPNEPKRRLEVWWNNPASRSDTYLIVINGQSNWIAPKGVHLGLGLQALEKLNKKPFKLKGFNKDNIAAVSDWQGGALATLPGGCKFGINMMPDPKATAEARSAVTADKDFDSNDAAMLAAKPIVGEILIGY
jgi:hypothetical protein